MKAFYRYIIFLFISILALSLYIPKRYAVSYPKTLGPDLDTYIRQSYKNTIEEEQTEIVMLGDSTLGYAVDATLLEEELQAETLSVSLPGTTATLWYLIIKNNIVPAEHKPAYLVLLVRDTVMTVPHYRTTGTYFNLIDEFASPEDTNLIEKAYINPMSTLERSAETYLPVYGSRWRIRESIDYYLRYGPPKVFFACNKDCVIKAMEDFFVGADIDEKHLGRALFAADTLLYTNKALNFNKSVSESFLPDIIQLTRENDIQLIVVRMRTKRFISQNQTPRKLRNYFVDMESYLNENGVIYLDFSDAQEITSADFDDDLHMNEQGQAIFTPMLIEALEKIIP